MASVISDRQSRNRPVWLNSVNDHDSLVWRAAGVSSGSAAFYFVHCWLDRHHRKPRTLSSPVCWRHADPGFLSPWVCPPASDNLVSMPGWRRRLDAGESSSVKHVEDRDSLVFHHAQARQSTVCCSQSWSWPCHAIINSTRPWHGHWQWCHHADPCVKDCIGVFCSLATALIHQALCVRNRVQVVGRIVGYATPRLRQCDTRRDSCLPAPTSAVGPQCCRQTGSSFV